MQTFKVNDNFKGDKVVRRLNCFLVDSYYYKRKIEAISIIGHRHGQKPLTSIH